MGDKYLKNIYLGSREHYYSIFVEKEGKCSETLIDKNINELEIYLTGLCDGLRNWGDLDDPPIKNGHPKKYYGKKYVDKLSKKDFERIKKYILGWNNFQLFRCLEDD